MENRVVLVTGGASGIGKGMVRMFADRGCQGGNGSRCRTGAIP